MNLIYLNPGDNAVMEAQVLMLLEYYNTMSDIKNIYLLQGFKNSSEVKILQRKLKFFRYPIIWFRVWPNYTFFQVLAFYSLKQGFKKIDLKAGNTIIHVRGDLYGALVARYLSREKLPLRLLVDIRGALSEEYQYYIKNKWLKSNKQRNALNRYAYLKKDIPITAVSSTLKEYLVSKYDMESKNIYVHVNIAGEVFKFNNTKRNELRQKLNFDQNELIAVCSTGGGAEWQRDKEVIAQLLKCGVRVINLAPKSLYISGALNKTVQFHEMPDYLSAADIAVLWRDDNVVNNVASPSKFSEFASMGLWIIHNGTVKIASEYIRKTGYGILISEVNQITPEIINDAKLNNRITTSQEGRKYFGVENIAQSYLSTYKYIIKNYK